MVITLPILLADLAGALLLAELVSWLFDNAVAAFEKRSH